MNKRLENLTSTDGDFMVPQLSSEWRYAARIVGTGEFISDLCMLQDKLGRWHSIGIVMDEQGRSDKMFHAIGDSIDKPYCHQNRIVSGRSDVEHMWAPFAIYKDRYKAWLYYAHVDKKMEFCIRVLESGDEGLDHWLPLECSEMEDGNIAFRETGSRDPVIFWDNCLSKYLMYYAGQKPSVVRCRTSEDLVHWSEPATVMGIPEGYTEAESPFVFRKNGYYYLFVSGFDYGRVSVYASADPFNFGDAVSDRIAEISGHAPEIVTVDGIDYIICAAISSRIGFSPGHHDLMGAYIQPIKWVKPEEGNIVDNLGESK